MHDLQQVDSGMVMHQHEVVFFAAEFARFLQDVFRDTDFPDVVQQRCDFQGSTLLIIPAQQLGNPTGDCRNSLSVHQRSRVLQLHTAQQQCHQLARKNLPFRHRNLLPQRVIRQCQQPNQNTTGVCRYGWCQTVGRQA